MNIFIYLITPSPLKTYNKMAYLWHEGRKVEGRDATPTIFLFDSFNMESIWSQFYNGSKAK